MKNRKRFAVLLAAAVTALCACMPAFAATRNPINSVKLAVKADIELDQKMGEEEIDVTITSGNYYFDSYEVQNVGFRWYSGDVPEIKVLLIARDNYYFNRKKLKASQISLTGAEYVTASIDNNATELYITMKLPNVGYAVDEPADALMNDAGLCTWSPVEGASGYEIRFMRESATLGGTRAVTEPSFDGGSLMTKGAAYTFKVRAISAMDASVHSEWTEGNTVTISDQEARDRRQAAIDAQSEGSWEQVGDRWRFRLPDGSYVASAWRYIYGEWYYFLDDGFMATGWQQVGDKWFYLDPANGKMWANCDTPDGYHLGIDGSMYELAYQVSGTGQ